MTYEPAIVPKDFATPKLSWAFVSCIAANASTRRLDQLDMIIVDAVWKILIFALCFDQLLILGTSRLGLPRSYIKFCFDLG